MSYLLPKTSTQTEREDLFLTITSDWDLDAAFRAVSSQSLTLKITQSQSKFISNHYLCC